MNWRKSSHSRTNGHCIETATWRKPTLSFSNGACFDIGTGPGVVGVRDSKLGDESPVIVFRAADWTAFTRRVRRIREANA